MQILAFNMKESNQMNDKYYEQAAACVKDRVLPAQMELYRSCSGDLDRIYCEAMNGNGYFFQFPYHVLKRMMRTWMFI